MYHVCLCVYVFSSMNRGATRWGTRKSTILNNFLYVRFKKHFCITWQRCEHKEQKYTNWARNTVFGRNLRIHTFYVHLKWSKLCTYGHLLMNSEQNQTKKRWERAKKTSPRKHSNWNQKVLILYFLVLRIWPSLAWFYTTIFPFFAVVVLTSWCVVWTQSSKQISCNIFQYVYRACCIETILPSIPIRLFCTYNAKTEHPRWYIWVYSVEYTLKIQNILNIACGTHAP